MRKLIWVILILLALWCIYWVTSATGLTKATNLWLKDRRAVGWAADAQNIQTRGFPMSFETTITDPRLADPITGIAWSGSEFEFSAPALKPYRATVKFPATHTLSTPFHTFHMANTKLMATAELRPTANLGLTQAKFDMQNLAITNQTGAKLALESGFLNVVHLDAATHQYSVDFAARNLEPGAMFDFISDRQNRLPDVFQTATISAVINFDRPWDRQALEQARPQPRTISLKRAEAKWGQLELAMAGEFTVDASGMPTGTVTIQARNWRDMLALAVENQIVSKNIADTAIGILRGLARASGNENTLDLPLEVKRGRIWLTFIPLGPAPRIILR